MTTKISAVPGTVLSKRSDFIKVQLANGRTMRFQTNHPDLVVGRQVPDELLRAFESVARHAPNFKSVTLRT